MPRLIRGSMLRRWRAAILLCFISLYCAKVAQAEGAEGVVGAAAAGRATAAATSAPASAPALAPARTMTLRWMPVPRVSGRITALQLGVVINTADPYSVAVGDYYVQRRQIPAEHVLRLALPHQPRLSVAELSALRAKVQNYFGPGVQALALVWTAPYAVECQSITSALSLGWDPHFCQQTCAAPRLPSPYFNSRSSTPWKDHGIRPSMLLAARTVAQAQALIDRGLASDHSLLRGAKTAHAHFQFTQDAARNVRARLFPPPGRIPGRPVEVHIGRSDLPADHDDLLLVQTGAAVLSGLDDLHWVPGALADHLTSFGGVLDGTAGQTSALAWIESGASASYGTVSEPCNHLQKFPHPQLLLQHYLQGSSAIEAYWKSVAWPVQGVFVGDPLAAPFASH